MLEPLSSELTSIYLELETIVGPQWVSRKETDRIAYARDQWPRSLLQLRNGRIEKKPDLIVWPGNPMELSKVVQICHARGIPLLPVGTASSTTGSTLPLRHGIAIDMKRMNHIRWIDKLSGLAEIEAGGMSLHVEEFLRREGMTLGHTPACLQTSTIGGWIAKRSEGQGSNLYGKIGEILEDIEVVLHDGSIHWLNGTYPILPFFLGSEGMFGIITAARLRIHSLPTIQRFRGILFPTIPKGLHAIREIVQSNEPQPSFIHLYDSIDRLITEYFSQKRLKPSHTSKQHMPNSIARVKQQKTFPFNRLNETFSSFLKHLGQQMFHQIFQNTKHSSSWIEKLAPTQSMLILGYEGHSRSNVDQQMNKSLNLCLEKDGKDQGESPGWKSLSRRYKTAFQQSKIFLSGAFSDTIHVFSTWSNAEQVYTNVRKSIQEHAFVISHFSQAYPEGCTLSFSFLSFAEETEELYLYDKICRSAIETVYKSGGSIHPSYGIGLGQSTGIPHALGQTGMKLFSSIHQAFSPQDLMNPGKLSLPERFIATQPREFISTHTKTSKEFNS